MKKIIMLALLLLLLSSTVFSQTSGEKLKELALVNGDENGHLNESSHLNRAQLATLLVQLNGEFENAKSYNGMSNFSDVNEDSWYYNYVNLAKDKEWLYGTSQAQFSPNDAVSEEMLATVLLRLLDYKPIWGEGKRTALALGIDIDVVNPQRIKRGEVFDYIYQFLMVKKKNQVETLAESIDVTLDLSPLYKGHYQSNRNTVVNIEGDKIALVQDKVAKIEIINGQRYLVNSSQKYGPFDEMRTIIESRNFPFDRVHLLRSETEYLLLDELYNILAKGVFITSESYEVDEITMQGVIYKLKDGEDKEGKNNLFYDHDMNLKVGEKDKSLAQRHQIVSFMSDLLLVKVFEGYTCIEHYLYQPSSDRIIKEIKANDLVLNKSSQEVMIRRESSTDVGIEIFNIITGESIAKSFESDKNTSTYLRWYEDGGYGLLTSVLKGEKVTAKTVLFSDELEEITRYPYYISKTLGAYYVVKDPSNYKRGLIDAEGNLIIDMVYNTIDWHSYYDYYEAELEYDTVYYNNKFQELSMDEISKFLILPTGGRIVRSPIRGYSFMNESNQVIIPFNDEWITYVQGVDLVVCQSRNSIYGGVYSTDGYKLSRFEEYDMVYSFYGHYIGAYKDGKTYIVNGDNELIYGPFDEEILFYGYQNQ